MTNAGDLGAIDRLLKVLDRLDRYHGFSMRGLPISPREKYRASNCWGNSFMPREITTPRQENP